MPFLYLKTKGWKTGKLHEIEIWYVELNGRFYLVSEKREKSHWVKNILKDPKISFRVGGQVHDGSGRVVDSKERELASKVRELMNHAYDWSDGLIIELTP